MEGFFNQDGWLYRFLNRLWDLIVLNLLFIVTCIPVITIGASVTALYTVTMRGVRNEESYIVQSYFRAFRENFQKATLIWLLLAVFWAVLGIDIFYIGKTAGQVGSIFVFAAGVFGIFWLLITLYAFPMQARFENSIPYTILNSFLAAVKFFPCTIQLIGIYAVVPLLATALSIMWPTGLGWMLSVMLFAGFSGIAWISSFVYRKAVDILVEQAQKKI